jgi:putative endonuclease
MRPKGGYIYITTNPKRTVLYIGVTNDLRRRLQEHWEDNQENRRTFAGQYFCYNLIYLEFYDQIETAIARESELKKWSRRKKEALIGQKKSELGFFKGYHLSPPGPFYFALFHGGGMPSIARHLIDFKLLNAAVMSTVGRHLNIFYIRIFAIHPFNGFN